jgi:hypothetical protein
MIDMFDRIPGPRHWVVWIVLVSQIVCGVLSIGTLAASSGAFLHSLMPVIDARVFGLLAALFAVATVWSGMFDVLKIVMSVFVLIIVLGAIYIAGHVVPGFDEFVAGFSFKMPAVPEWAASTENVSSNAWDEVLPVLGWGAGGFASQVWYAYWVLGAGYGAAKGRGYGKSADVSLLKRMSRETALRVKGWCRVLYADATIAMVIGITVTAAFLIAGAGILRSEELVPSNADMPDVLSRIFSEKWSSVGGGIFKTCGAVALISTLVGLLAGWPRILADACRICIPGFGKRLAWKSQFRLFVVMFLVSGMLIVFLKGNEPIFLLKLSSIVEGVLLTALQAMWVALGLFIVMPKLLSEEAHEVLRPNRVFAVGLLATFIAFGYICVTRIPPALAELFAKGGG